jgi:putative thioredoxin
LLERLATEHAGAFVLARVDTDQAPAVAQAFRIQSIPAVKAFRDGVVVAEFVGAQPETVVREFLRGVLPSEADTLAREGAARAAAGQAAEAEAKFRAALAFEACHAPALLGLARILADRGEVTEAIALLERVPPNASVVGEAERLAAALRTRAASGDVDALRARLATAPDDVAARLDLGRALAAQGRHEEALAELLEVVRRDRAFADDAARKAMVDLFAVLGSDHPLTERYRGELAKALFR